MDELQGQSLYFLDGYKKGLEESRVMMINLQKQCPALISVVVVRDINDIFDNAIKLLKDGKDEQL